MEASIVLAFAWWGFQATGTAAGDIALGVGAPILVFGVWGLLDFRWAGRWAEPLRLIEELAISGLAAVAWYAAGRHALAWTLACVSVAHHGVTYLTGQRLLKNKPATKSSSAD